MKFVGIVLALISAFYLYLNWGSDYLDNRRCVFQLCVYYKSNESRSDIESQVRKILNVNLPQVPFYSDRDIHDEEKYVSFIWTNDVAKDLPFYDIDTHQRGLVQFDISDLKRANQAISLIFVGEGPGLSEFLSHSHDAMLEFSILKNGILWDSNSKNYFSNTSWSKFRTFPKSIRSMAIPEHISILQYKTDGYLRITTTGMSKFGLPDISANDFPKHLLSSMAGFVEIVSQLLMEKRIELNGELQQISIKDISNEKLRNYFLEQALPGAKLSCKVLLVWHQLEDDNDNDEFEIKFPELGDLTQYEAQSHHLAKFWGAKDAKIAKHALIEFKKPYDQAKQLLPAIKERFIAGLKSGENLYLKAPFATSIKDKLEWMWFEVTVWGDTVEGVLVNTPEEVPSLIFGSKVSVPSTAVVDYMIKAKNGKTEGNFSAQVTKQ